MKRLLMALILLGAFLLGGLTSNMGYRGCSDMHNAPPAQPYWWLNDTEKYNLGWYGG